MIVVSSKGLLKSICTRRLCAETAAPPPQQQRPSKARSLFSARPSLGLAAHQEFRCSDNQPASFCGKSAQLPDPGLVETLFPW